jgi:hypothetical protein
VGVEWGDDLHRQHGPDQPTSFTIRTRTHVTTARRPPNSPAHLGIYALPEDVGSTSDRPESSPVARPATATCNLLVVTYWDLDSLEDR